MDIFLLRDIFNTQDTFLLAGNHSGNFVGLMILTFVKYKYHIAKNLHNTSITLHIFDNF